MDQQMTLSGLMDELSQERGLLLKKGTIEDLALISAPFSTF